MTSRRDLALWAVGQAGARGQHAPHVLQLVPGELRQAHLVLVALQEDAQRLAVVPVAELLHVEARDAGGLGHDAGHLHVLHGQGGQEARHVHHPGHSLRGDEVAGAPGEGRVARERVFLGADLPLAAAEALRVVVEPADHGVVEAGLVAEQEVEQAREVHQRVLVHLHDEASAGTAAADPAQPRQRLERQVPVGVVEVPHDQVVVLLGLLLQAAGQVGVRRGAQHEEDLAGGGERPRDAGPVADADGAAPRPADHPPRGGVAGRGRHDGHQEGRRAAGAAGIGQEVGQRGQHLAAGTEVVTGSEVKPREGVQVQGGETGGRRQVAVRVQLLVHADQQTDAEQQREARGQHAPPAHATPRDGRQSENKPTATD